MIKKGDKVYLVKYALSGGIKRVVIDSGYDDRVKPVGFSDYYTVDKEIFANSNDAIAAANAMREKKIVSLKKQIAKLEKRDFAAELAKAEGSQS